MAPIGTQVRVVNQPFVFGWHEGALHIQGIHLRAGSQAIEPGAHRFDRSPGHGPESTVAVPTPPSPGHRHGAPMTANAQPHPELGFYALAGQPDSSRDLLDEVRDAEAMGLGTAFISERYNQKEAATLCGAAGAVSERIHIQTAATNHNTRHPMVTAGFARTMQSLTGGRFVLGIGRGIPAMQDAYGMSRITTAQMEDFVGIMRRLFRGEVIVGHDGPAGSWPVLHLDAPSTSTCRWASWPSARRRSSWAGAASTRSCCTPTSPTRPPSGPCAP